MGQGPKFGRHITGRIARVSERISHRAEIGSEHTIGRRAHGGHGVSTGVDLSTHHVHRKCGSGLTTAAPEAPTSRTEQSGCGTHPEGSSEAKCRPGSESYEPPGDNRRRRAGRLGAAEIDSPPSAIRGRV